MNVPVVPFVEALVKVMGTDSTLLGGGHMGLIKAPFSSSDSITMGDITEANYEGYSRVAYGNPSVPFVSNDGNVYVQGLTCVFQPTGDDSPNTIYGVFVVSGHDTATIQLTDGLDQPVPLATTANSLTIIPRFGLKPTNGLGFNGVLE